MPLVKYQIDCLCCLSLPLNTKIVEINSSKCLSHHRQWFLLLDRTNDHSHRFRAQCPSEGPIISALFTKLLIFNKRKHRRAKRGDSLFWGSGFKQQATKTTGVMKISFSLADCSFSFYLIGSFAAAKTVLQLSMAQRDIRVLDSIYARKANRVRFESTKEIH